MTSPNTIIASTVIATLDQYASIELSVENFENTYFYRVRLHRKVESTAPELLHESNEYFHARECYQRAVLSQFHLLNPTAQVIS